MKKKEILLSIGSAIAAVILYVGFVALVDTPGQGGPTARATTFNSAATSGPMTVTSDAQILATSTRAYAIICNDSAQVVYLGLDADKAVTQASGIRLNASGGCYEINADNLYQGAIRASSTNETASVLLINEYKAR